MERYRLKTGRLGEAVVSAYQAVEDAVVESYKKMEQAFMDAFLERLMDFDGRPGGGTADQGMEEAGEGREEA